MNEWNGMAWRDMELNGWMNDGMEWHGVKWSEVEWNEMDD